MSRPVVLVFLLVVLIFTSQFEWRQQLASEADSTPGYEAQKRHQISEREESVKEKIILSQEKNIQMLTELVQSLKEEIRLCHSNNETANATLTT